jgi:hypothetical protein
MHLPIPTTHPPNTKEPEPQQWDSGPKRITSRATVSGDLAWGRGKLQPAHWQRGQHLFMGVRRGVRLVERIRIDKANALISCVQLLLVVRSRF